MLIKSKRLILRRFKNSDKDALFEYLSDEDVVAFEPYKPFTLDMIEEEVKSRTDNPSFIAVCLKDTDKLIGNLYYCKIEPDKINTYELGYVFNKKYHGKGYEGEAADCLLDYLYNTLKAHRVVAYCNIKNTASWRLLEKLNFRREAERTDNMFFNEDSNGPLWFSSYQYALLEREYNKR